MEDRVDEPDERMAVDASEGELVHCIVATPKSDNRSITQSEYRCSLYSWVALSLLYLRAASRATNGQSAFLARLVPRLRQPMPRDFTTISIQQGPEESSSLIKTQHNMTVTETLKDAVGLGHGGPSTRTFNAMPGPLSCCHLSKRTCDIEQGHHVTEMIEQRY